MAKTGTILVGTVGQGVMRTADGGETWTRGSIAQGLHSDAVVRCLGVHPRQPEIVYAGTDLGLYRSDDAGGRWGRLDTPMNTRAVWSVAIDEANPEMMLAGTGTPTPGGLFQSIDGGESWQERSAQFAETCPAVGVPRPTAIAIDPTDHRSVWMGIEVDGVRHSRDGGSTWEKAGLQITNPDVHNALVTRGPTKRIFILVNNDAWVSDDDGSNWAALGLRENFPYHYARGIAVRPDDPSVVFITVGDATPGRTGAIMRTQDNGRSWDNLPLPTQANSAMWTISISPSDPNHMIAGTRYGYLYASEDGGDSWTKFWRELSEISSIAMVPA